MEASQTAVGGDGDGGEVVRELAGAISGRLKLSSRSATLNDIVASGCWYVVPDEAAREIVFDMRALYLGFLAAGLHPQRGNIGNTARWFQEWLVGKVGEGAVTEALKQRSDMTLAGRLLGSGFAPVPSVSVGGLQDLAKSYALRTVKRPAFDARHLFAAMIERRAITEMTERVFRVSLTDDDIDDLKRDLVEQIMRSPQRGETRDIWFQALHVSLAQPSGPSETPPDMPPSPSPDRPEDAVSPFSGDTPSAQGDDVLDTEQDVEALAQLVCLDGAAPLAVAIFGDWGSGKSTFMARLEARVRTLAREEAGLKRPTPDEAGLARFVQPIVQIRFNAWHFADANLWASLTAEFFDQLRAGGYDRTGQARHAELVEKVNLHVHALSNAVSANREAVTQGAKDLLAAQAARDSAAKGVRDAARSASVKALGQATMDVLGQSLAEQKGLLTTLGLMRERKAAPTAPAADGAETAEPQAETARGAEVIVGVVQDLASTFGKSRAIGRVLFRTPLRAAIAGLLLAVVLGAGAAILFAPGKWAALATLLAALGGLAPVIAPVVKLVNGVAERGAAIAAEVDKADKGAVSLLLTQEAKLKKALAEAKALEEAELASARALSRYIDPAGASNPPRLLRYVLEDDPDTKALEKDIGLIGRTRRLFQAVDDIARDMREQRRAPGYAERKDADRETPERIVIYIDDLDRCSETKVYEVLQAIHLLLAFDLFVVVVGVDVRWVRAALARQFDDDLDLDDKAREERAVAYLEKIFQVPFWLRPLSSGAEGTFGRFVRSLAGASAEESAEARARLKTIEDAAKAAREAAPETPTTGAPVEPGTLAAKPPPPATRAETVSIPVAEARRTLQLTKAEIDFLASPAIAAVAAAAPRGVKRLVNIYRLARTRRGQEDRDAVLGGGAPPEYPLIALMAAVETGQGHAAAEAFYDLLKASQGRSLSDALRRVWTPQPLDPPPSASAGLSPATAKLLLDACQAAAELRNLDLAADDLLADDLLAAARLVRRYSFNRYR